MIVFIYNNQHFLKICQDRQHRIIQLQNCFVNYVIIIFIYVTYPTLYTSSKKIKVWNISYPYWYHSFYYSSFFFTSSEKYKRMEWLVHVQHKCCQYFWDDDHDQFSDKKNVFKLQFESIFLLHFFCMSTSLINIPVKRSGFVMFN